MVKLRNKILLTSNNLSELEMQETHLNAYGMIKGIKWRIHNRLKVWLLVSTKNLLGTITKQFEDEKAGMVYHLFAVMNSIAMVESLQRGFVDEEI